MNLVVPSGSNLPVRQAEFNEFHGDFTLSLAQRRVNFRNVRLGYFARLEHDIA